MKKRVLMILVFLFGISLFLLNFVSAQCAYEDKDTLNGATCVYSDAQKTSLEWAKLNSQKINYPEGNPPETYFVSSCVEDGIFCEKWVYFEDSGVWVEQFGFCEQGKCMYPSSSTTYSESGHQCYEIKNSYEKFEDFESQTLEGIVVEKINEFPENKIPEYVNFYTRLECANDGETSARREWKDQLEDVYGFYKDCYYSLGLNPKIPKVAVLNPSPRSCDFCGLKNKQFNHSGFCGLTELSTIYLIPGSDIQKENINCFDVVSLNEDLGSFIEGCSIENEGSGCRIIWDGKPYAGECILGSCFVESKFGKITNTKLEIDNKYLNSFIDKTLYDESVKLNISTTEGTKTKTFKIATEKDKLICGVDVEIPMSARIFPMPGSPINSPTVDEGYLNKTNIEIVFKYSRDGEIYGRPNMGYKLNLKKDCKIDYDNWIVRCEKSKLLNEYDKGLAIKCNANILAEEPICESTENEKTREIKGDIIESNEFVVATYPYYFVPVNVVPSAFYEGQYSYYTQLSEVNDKINLVGKRILLKRADVDLSRECCAIGLFPDIWVLKGNCRKKYWGIPVSDEKCAESTSKHVFAYYGSDVLSTVSPLIKNKLGKQFISDAVPSFYFPSEAIGWTCYGSESESDGACAVDYEYVFLSESSRVQTLTHELGHVIGKACDEYSLEYWKKQNKERRGGCPNSISEGEGVAKGDENSEAEPRFPKCCFNPLPCFLNNGICLKDSGGLSIHKDSKTDEPYSCYPLSEEYKCYKPECETDTDCQDKGKCFCEGMKKICISCENSNDCQLDKGTPFYVCKNSSTGTIKQCDGTDTSCLAIRDTDYKGSCADCTIGGHTCIKDDRKGPLCESMSRTILDALGSPCGNPEFCLGMPFLEKNDGKGEKPRDINYPEPVNIHSIMGIGYIEQKVLPKSLPCPLRGCY